MIGLVLMTAGHLGAWLLAIAITSRLRLTGAAGVTGALVLHALVVTLIVLIVGSLGLLGPWPLTAGGVAAGIAGMAGGAVPAVRAASFRARDLAVATWRESPAGASIVLSVLAAVIVRHLYNTWYFCPATFDEMEYHLPKLAMWIQHGTLARPDSLDTRTYFPSGTQLLQVWWVGFLRHDAFIEGAALEALALAFAACAALVRRLGGSLVGALLAGTLYAATPMAMLHGTSAMSDLPAAAMILAAIALTTTRAAILVGAAAVLFGAGLKPIALFAVPGIAIAWTAWRRLPALDVPRAAALALLALAGFAGSYWYLRNAVEYGNPFYPVQASPVGRTVHVSLGEGTTSTGPNVRSLVSNLGAIFGPRLVSLARGEQREETNPCLPNRTGWGWALTFAGLPAVAWMAWREPRWRRVAAAFLTSMVFVLLCVQVDPWTARFVLFVPGVFAIAVAALPRTAVIAAVVGAASIANVVQAWVPLAFTPPGAAERMRSRPVADRDAWVVFFAHSPPPFAASYDAVMEMCFGTPVYALAGGDFRRRVEHVVTSDPSRLMRKMDELRCRWLIVNHAPKACNDAVEQCVADGKLRRAAPGVYERP